MLVLKVVLRPHLKPISSGPVVDFIKLFLEEISISPKLRNWKTFVLMSKPALKCESNERYFQAKLCSKTVYYF